MKTEGENIASVITAAGWTQSFTVTCFPKARSDCSPEGHEATQWPALGEDGVSTTQSEPRKETAFNLAGDRGGVEAFGEARRNLKPWVGFGNLTAHPWSLKAKGEKKSIPGRSES